MDQYGFYGNVSYADEYRHRYRPYNRSTGMSGFGAIQSGGYRGALGRIHGGLAPAPGPSSRASDFAMMRGLGMTPAGPRMGMGGLGLTDREACSILATAGVELINAISTGTRPPDLDPARHTQNQIDYRRRQQADYDRIQGMAVGGGRALVNFCNLIDQGQQTVPPGYTPPPPYYPPPPAQQGSKKMMQAALLVGGGVAAAAAIYFLTKG